MYCFCQRKLTLINKPIVPYVYAYTGLGLFLAIFYLVKIYLKSFQFLAYTGETTFEFLTICFISFLYIFYVIFDLQFILSNSQQGGGGGEEEERELSSITAAFNLLTKDIIQLIFLFNSYILNSIK